MAQFDVHRNPRKNRDTIPFVVLVQPTLFDSYRRRVVVSLVRKSAFGAISDHPIKSNSPQRTQSSQKTKRLMC